MYFVAVLLATLFISSHAFVYGGNHGKPSMMQTYANGKLTGFLEKLRDMLRNGDSKLGIPVMDPFTADQIPIVFQEKGIIDVDLLLTNVKAEGLSSYKVDAGDFSVIGLKVDVGLTWPEIAVSTNYAGKGTLADTVQFHGSGDVSLVIKDLSVSLKMSLRVRNKRLQVNNVDAKFSLGGLDCKITGLYDDEELSELFSTVISEITPGLIDDYQKDIAKFVNEAITEVGNDLLKDMTMKDLLDLIG